MPLIEVTMVAGRTPEQVRALISALTHAAAQAVDAPLDSIRVVVREVPTTHWGAGDVTIAERREAAEAAADLARAGFRLPEDGSDEPAPAPADEAAETAER